jgi:hypothetical protein
MWIAAALLPSLVAASLFVSVLRLRPVGQSAQRAVAANATDGPPLIG